MTQAEENCWKDMILVPEGMKGFRDELAEMEDYGLCESWDYWIGGVRSFQVDLHRDPEGRFVIDMEAIFDHRRIGGDVLGQCIRMQTRQVPRDEIDAEVLGDVTLAVNVYRGDGADVRLGQDLSAGTVCTPSPSTRLLLCEGVPFLSVLFFGTVFVGRSDLFPNWWLQLKGRGHLRRIDRERDHPEI